MLILITTLVFAMDLFESKIDYTTVDAAVVLKRSSLS